MPFSFGSIWVMVTKHVTQRGELACVSPNSSFLLPSNADGVTRALSVYLKQSPSLDRLHHRVFRNHPRWQRFTERNLF